MPRCISCFSISFVKRISFANGKFHCKLFASLFDCNSHGNMSSGMTAAAVLSIVSGKLLT